jgi:malate dehydrogenase (oxaloacetate-decarboxylating)(NADP+)
MTDDTSSDHALRGVHMLHDPRLNKGTAFTDDERERLGLRGLLPPRVLTMEDQVSRVLDTYGRKTNDLDRYVNLIGLQDRNETLFYRVLIDHIETLMPIVYTPTVGEACRQFGHIYRRPRGLYVSMRDRGRMSRLLQNWPEQQVSIIVVTDGERILGLGDLGTYGMGIPIGKLALYTTCAGIPPRECLPITLDVGTNNEELRADPLYTGLLQPRVRGAEYDEFIEEFVMTVQDIFPDALIQFEDFATTNALELLDRYRERVCCFNDDIQGTAGVTLAGLLAVNRITRGRLGDQRLLFYGAGAAATGIADLIADRMTADGLSLNEARRRIWFVDSKGLVVSSRSELAPHKRRYAHDAAFESDLTSIVRAIRPTALIGVSGQARQFSQTVVAAMADGNERPVIFALSNPTSKAECTAEEAYRWSDGRAIYASGSPFDPVTVGGRTMIPAQGNNAYVFPGVGLGVIATRARHVTDEMFAAAAQTLAGQVAEPLLDQGSLLPPFREIREVSLEIATAVAEVAFTRGLARIERPSDLREYLRAAMYQPVYDDVVR